MTKTKHYIPILKWKRAEQGALSEIKEKNKKHITPLIQFVMPKPKQPKEGEHEKTDNEQYTEVLSSFKDKISCIPDEILSCWGKDAMFIDFSLIYTSALKIESYEKVITNGEKLGLQLIPVLNLSDDYNLIKIVSSLADKYKRGLCLRLVCSDFTDMADLQNRINKIKTSSLLEDKIDLLVDIKEIESGDGKFNKYIKLSQNFLNVKLWRSFVFASGAFPQDLSMCKIDEENLIPRLDWKQWLSFLNNKKLRRQPSFADYTIQYPIYLEATQFFHPTTSIKYTLEDDWNIMKGKKQKYELYLAHANVLLKNDDYFFGEDFSFGDKFIAEKGRHFEKYIKNPTIKGTGNTEQWIKAHINHHMECTANQIANLF
ncbi:beta family protein [Candidatus Parcubacteria bacterium]|nr:beta family protein [Patescibacteria group bacterium]MCG2691046.1 beta family protein [Candidatus Parcubacteria bacterium]